MTTFTIETGSADSFTKTRFKTAADLLAELLRHEFEAHLDRQQTRAQRAPKTDFVSL